MRIYQLSEKQVEMLSKLSGVSVQELIHAGEVLKRQLDNPATTTARYVIWKNDNRGFDLKFQHETVCNFTLEELNLTAEVAE